jgi:hypothetical protein
MFGWTTDIVLELVNTALEAEKIHFPLNIRN